MSVNTNSAGKAVWWSGKPYVRPRLGTKRRPLLALPTDLSHDAADERAHVVLAIIARLKAAGRMRVAEELAKKAASATNVTELKGVMIAVDAICRGAVVDRPKLSGAMTFQDFAENWTSGKLHTEFPQYVRLKRTADDDAVLLKKHINPIIGTVPLAAITIEHAHEVMRRIPSGLSSATHRHVAQVLNRVLKLAVYPSQLLARSPLPQGFLPRIKRAHAFTYLYPAEDAAVLACTTDVGLVHRLLYGFLAREGMRVTEAKQLDWRDVDLHRGLVHLDENKTDDPRAWALDVGVVEALRRWHDHFHPKPTATARIFCDAAGDPLLSAGRADDLRSHLAAAKLTRSQLFERSKTRRPIRVHDLRATFVTVALACGRSETWVADRTGHRSSTQIHRYRRQARAHEELGLGPLAPLVDAIPELRDAPPSPAGKWSAVLPRLRNTAPATRSSGPPIADRLDSEWTVTRSKSTERATGRVLKFPSGERGIRTPGTLTSTSDFESDTFGLSVSSPGRATCAIGAHLVKRIVGASWAGRGRSVAQRASAFRPARLPCRPFGRMDHPLPIVAPTRVNILPRPPRKSPQIIALGLGTEIAVVAGSWSSSKCLDVHPSKPRTHRRHRRARRRP
jgi:integrase